MFVPAQVIAQYVAILCATIVDVHVILQTARTKLFAVILRPGFVVCTTQLLCEWTGTSFKCLIDTCKETLSLCIRLYGKVLAERFDSNYCASIVRVHMVVQCSCSVDGVYGTVQNGYI